MRYEWTLLKLLVALLLGYWAGRRDRHTELDEDMGDMDEWIVHQREGAWLQ